METLTMFDIGLVLFITITLTEAVAETGQKLSCYRSRGGTSVYNFTLTDIQGERNVSLPDYKGKVLLVVNTASFSSATPQYQALNDLYNRYSNLEIIAAPCNQFGLREPGNNATEILASLEHVRPGNGFQPNFTMLQKTEVNGENEHPLYTYLKRRCPPPNTGFASREYLFYTPLDAKDIRWNFEKFLVNCQGEPVTRFSSGYQPDDMTPDIQQLLYECNM